MRIGLASDSLGDVDALARALDVFEREGVDRIFFLGARWSDLDAALALRAAPPPAAPAAPPAGGGGAGDLDFLAAVEGALKSTARAAGGLRERVQRVASRTCPEYGSGVPTKLVDLVEGRICCLVHDKAELTRDDITNAAVVFHGRSAQAGLVQFGPRVFVTPGPLSPPPGGAASLAVVELGPAAVAMAVHDLAGAVVRRERAGAAGAAPRLSVK